MKNSVIEELGSEIEDRPAGSSAPTINDTHSVPKSVRFTQASPITHADNISDNNNDDAKEPEEQEP